MFIFHIITCFYTFFFVLFLVPLISSEMCDAPTNPFFLLLDHKPPPPLFPAGPVLDQQTEKHGAFFFTLCMFFVKGD